MTVEAFAPAKINLTLHVTGQRADGYHLLDSLVMFADVGDRLTVTRASETTLQVTGPMAAGVPTDHRNLVVQAAALLGVTARITLDKHLPAAAGIGGGSSDAAAALCALCALYDLPAPGAADLVTLGADVPVCMHSGWVRMRGIGDALELLGPGPGWPMLIINPRVPVPTGDVFQALPRKDNPPMPDEMPNPKNAPETLRWLAAQRNDLEAPAVALQPVIGQVLRALSSSRGCELARMSGSGATCFGLFANTDSRDAAQLLLQQTYPDWWIAATTDARA